MRKVAQIVGEAFRDGKAKTCGNTSTDGTTVFLFGNEIMHRCQDGQIAISTAGWNTNTTRSRLDDLLCTLDLPFGVYQVKGQCRVRALDTGIETVMPDSGWFYLPHPHPQTCPFKVGDAVVRNGLDLGWHHEGQTGVVAKIGQDGEVVVRYADGERTTYRYRRPEPGRRVRNTWDALTLQSAQADPVQAGPVPEPAPVVPAFDPLAAMIAWEQGDLDIEQTVELFQHLIDTGMAWSLQGCYGRQAQALIEEGYCHA